MEYQIINNLPSKEGHSSRLKVNFKQSDTVILASPFLMQDFATFWEDEEFKGIKNFHLVTTLCPYSSDQIKKIKALKSLLEIQAVKTGSICCHISINNHLHGKVYIFKKDGEYTAAIISSANFTDSGLRRNHEWGVEIFDPGQIKALEQDLLKNMDLVPLSPETIDRMYKEAEEYLGKQLPPILKDIDLDLMKLLPGRRAAVISEKVNYWMKPIGSSDDPLSGDRLYNEAHDYLHFAVQPTGVKVNDILICYAVGSTKMLSVFKVLTGHAQVSEDDIKENKRLERWPWYVEGQNLTPNYGAAWGLHRLYKSDLLDEYRALYPDRDITAVGGKNLEAFKYGRDKLNLDPAFAKFIIDKMFVINDRNVEM